MSGYKRATVSISQDEYDRLREAETKLRAIPEPNHESQKVIQDNSLQILHSTLDELRSREDRYQAILSGMDGQVQDLALQTNQKMVELEVNTIAQVEQNIGNLWDQFGELLYVQEKNYENYLAEINRKNQEQIQYFISEVNQLHDDAANKQVIAETWEAMSLDLYFYIQTEYAHEFFLPGAMERFEFQISQASHNINQGLFEAAVSNFQPIYQNLSDTRLSLEKQYQEWRVLFQTAFEAINEVNLRLENSRLIQALDLEGQEIPFLIDVNQWTGSRLTDLKNRVIQYGEMLFDPEQSPTKDFLLNLLNIEFPRVMEEIQAAILEARIKAINSQLRINIADLVVQALRQQGFAVQESEYEDNDKLREYDVMLKNFEGNQVVVRITPTGENVGDNELQIESLDAEQKTEHELHRRWLEISGSLQEIGLDVGPYTRLDSPTAGRQSVQGSNSNSVKKSRSNRPAK